MKIFRKSFSIFEIKCISLQCNDETDRSGCFRLLSQILIKLL